MSHTKNKREKIKNKKQRGVSLLFIVLIVSLILAVGLGISALLIREMRMMGEIGYSVIALYAADSGVEEAIYDLYQSLSPSPEHSGYLDSAYYHTWAKCCNPDLENCSLEAPEECPLGPDYVGSSDPADPDYCNALNYCLKSLGSYKKVKRAIEIKY
jgi:Tfp pilus assembly protein PilV